MRIIFCLALFAFVGCTKSSQHRFPSSATSAFEESLDTKLETPWKGDIAAENKTLQNLGRVIGDFVAEEAKSHQTWRQELQQLRSKGHLSNSEEKRKAALEIILRDLPNSPGLATRDVHRRPQACLAATFKVSESLAPENQKGLFARGATYDAIVRFSNGNPRNLPDIAPDARGMAVKLLPQGTLPADDLSAAKLNEKGLLDILAINFPVFFVNDPDKYVKINQAFLRATNDPSKAIDPDSVTYKYYEALSVFLRGMTEWEQELALDVNGSIILNPLHEEYWSMMAYRLGEERDPERTAIKYKWTPCQQNLPKEGSPEWTKSHDYAKLLAQLKHLVGLPIPKEVGKSLSTPENRYYLRKNLLEALIAASPAEKKKCFALQIQRYIDEDNTSVEDTTEIWLENKWQQKFWAKKFSEHGGPAGRNGTKRRYDRIMSRKIAEPVTVGILEIEPVPERIYKSVLSGETTNTSQCENLSFDPWNNVPSAHKPLGIVGRMRKFAYAGSKHKRHQLNEVSEQGR